MTIWMQLRCLSLWATHHHPEFESKQTKKAELWVVKELMICQTHEAIQSSDSIHLMPSTGILHASSFRCRKQKTEQGRVVVASGRVKTYVAKISTDKAKSLERDNGHDKQRDSEVHVGDGLVESTANTGRSMAFLLMQR